MKINYKCFLVSLTMALLLAISNLTIAQAQTCPGPAPATCCPGPPTCVPLCTSFCQVVVAGIIWMHACDGIHFVPCGGSGGGGGGKHIGNLAPDDVAPVAPVTPRGPRRGPAAVRFEIDAAD